ncbi:hypothetical protein KFJ24_01200 [Marinobacter sediminum]|uniref:hypothetical protein n=1 Tax=Marinobacter sediminum TaxID=256323 RepID=UPI00202FDD2C|nr:hypothetical protein [Marinobacter sediminum]MCM0611087.1 hypothetical protein [Marinobacter sediminum]
MKRLLSLSASVLISALAGCGEESDQLPVDGRDFDGVEYSEPATYTGKVIDGYLSNARVWLDMDGDSQYTAGPLVIQLDNGAEVTLPSGEPTTLSGAGGEFSLDVSELALDPETGPDLDPRNYSLYALALPGKTLEETRNGDVVIDSAFMMSAPAGIRNITPLTTLARYRALAGLFLSDSSNLAASLFDLNLVRDYMLAQDDRAHAYARALARFMASQFPPEYSKLLADTGSDGTEQFLSRQAAFLLGISMVQNSGDVIAVVDAAAQAGYANVDVDALVLPQVAVELSDPVLLTRQRIYAEPERSDTLPANRSDLLVSAELAFDYGEDGRLLSVSANGCLAPSMAELSRLIGVGGYMANLETQWLPSAALSPQSRINYEVAGTDERLVFDWNNQRIYFETATTCHDHESIFAGSTELGGNPEISYNWTMQDGGLSELIAQIPQPDGSMLTRTLEPEAVNASAGFPGYRLSEGGAEVASLVFTGSVQGCELEPDAVGADLVVSASQGYEFSGYESQLAGLAYEFDNREFEYPAQGDAFPVNRLLRYGFLDPAMSDLPRVEAGAGFEWVMYYPPVGGVGFLEGQPNHIGEAYLKKYSGARACGRKFEDVPSSAYARVEYSYKKLSEYLVGLLQ